MGRWTYGEVGAQICHGIIQYRSSTTVFGNQIQQRNHRAGFCIAVVTQSAIMGSVDATEVKEKDVIPLLTPFKLGKFELSHRVVLAPLTRSRAPGNVIGKAAIKYYSDRATPGGFLITEATVVAPTGHGFPYTPGVYTKEQIEAWKLVVNAVHEKSGIIFLQLWHVGRQSSVDYQPNRQPPVSGSSKRNDIDKVLLENYTLTDSSKPHQLTTEEIPQLIELWRIAARNAIEAGFDGVEIHGGNGYLIEDFLKDSVNDRTDQYGPQSYENRTRFVLELYDVIAAEVGADRVALRTSVFSHFNNATTSDPIPLGLYLIEQLNKRDLLYLHGVEPRIKGNTEIDTTYISLPLKKAFKGPYIGAGGFDREEGNAFIAEGKADLIAYGRFYISNPDLVKRFALNAPLNPYDRDTFYSNDPVKGYNDYPLLSDSVSK